MLNKLKRKLRVFYTVASGIVIALVLIFAFAQSQREETARKSESFTDEFSSIEQTLTNENVVQLNWLRECENRLNAEIYIEDNGKGVFNDNTSEHIKEVYAFAEMNGISLEPPSRLEAVSRGSIGTDMFRLSDGGYAEASLIPIWRTNDKTGIYENIGWRLLVVCQSFPHAEEQMVLRISIYIAIGLVGTLAMFALNKRLLARAIRPAEDFQDRQKEFIAAASHELRGPLSVMRANIAMVDTKNKSDPYLAGIEDECDRMSSLVSDMLALASADSATLSLNQTSVDVDSLLISVYERYAVLCKEQGVRLELLFSDEYPSQITTDAERIAQILGIFMDNALAHSGAQRIELCCTGVDGGLRLSVRDHGKGISDDMKKAVFQSFFRGDSSRSDRRHFGLGLSLAKRISELLNARVGVKDTASGGAEFYVELF